jgi:hypothetical protein
MSYDPERVYEHIDENGNKYYDHNQPEKPYEPGDNARLYGIIACCVVTFLFWRIFDGFLLLDFTLGIIAGFVTYKIFRPLES